MDGLELEESNFTNTVVLRAFGHAKPWIGEITGAHPTYRYNRNFLGARGIYKGGNCAILSLSIPTLTTPRLLEIQAAERGFFVLHINPSHRAELAPLDEITLQDLLTAKEYAAAIVDLEMRQRLETQRQQYQDQIAAQFEHERLSKVEKAALKRKERRDKRLALIQPETPTRKINFDK